MGKVSNRNELLNFFKGIGCIGIIFIHVCLPNKMGMIISKMAQFGVPLFIMIAGWYAFGRSNEVLIKRLKKHIGILVYGIVVYALYNIVFYSDKITAVSWIISNFTWKSFIKANIFCTIDFAIPLWYLIAMSETYLFWIIIRKLKLDVYILKSLPLLFVFRIVLWTICETYNFSWSWKVNFVASALPFFLFGYYVHKTFEEKWKNVRWGIYTIVSMVGLGIAIIPVLIDVKVNISCIGIIMYAIPIFIIAMKYPGKSISRSIEYIGDKLSLNVYILHVPLSGIISYIMSNILCFTTQSVLYEWSFPILTAGVSILLAYVIERIRAVNKFL